MIIKEIGLIASLFDALLHPFMWVLGRFKFPVQRTHAWHVQSINSLSFKNAKGVLVKGRDKKAKYFHDSPFGLFHMPIFGGITKYVAIEAKGFKGHWHVGWDNRKYDIHRLKIKKSGIKLLVARGDYKVYGFDDTGSPLQLKVLGYGQIGDKKFEGLELF